MQLVDWLLIACITIFAGINAMDALVFNERSRSTLLSHAVLSIAVATLFLSGDKGWAAAYCALISLIHLALMRGLRKKNAAE